MLCSIPACASIAIANPEHAPYGRAAVAALEHDHICHKVKDKLVMGENISQAAQFALSGDADAGILALSLTLAPAMTGKGRHSRFRFPRILPLTRRISS